MAAKKKTKTNRKVSTSRVAKKDDGNQMLFVLAVVASIVVGGYLFISSVKTSQLKMEERNKAMMPSQISVVLNEQTNSKQGGSVTLKEENGKVVVTVEVGSGAKNIAQPAHIHMGACPTPGDVVFPLNNVVNGKSVTTLDTTLASLKSKLPLAINVHKSAAQSKVYVACGDISFSY